MSTNNTTQTDYSSKEYYLKTWYNVLNAFLGWSESQVTEWANQTNKLEPLDNPDDLIYHQQPCYWLINVIAKEFGDKEGYNKRHVYFGEYLRSFLLENEYKGLWPLDTNWHIEKARFVLFIRQVQRILDIANKAFKEQYGL